MFCQIPFIEETAFTIILGTVVHLFLCMTNFMLFQVTGKWEFLFAHSTSIIQGFMHI